MLKLYKIVKNKVNFNFSKIKKISSYLYVTGDKARSIYSSIQPHVEFDERIQNIDELDNNIKKRKIDVNVFELKNLWDFYKTRLDYKQKLEANWKEIKSQLDTLLTNNKNGCNDDDIETLKLKSKLVRDDLKNITKSIWDIENNVVLKVLQVPNKLHLDVPDDDVVIGSFNQRIDYGNDHLDIGKHHNCLDYQSKSSYFLKNDLALFEIITGQYVVNKFKNCGFIPMCNPDFGRSVLIEGCTLKDYAPDLAFVLNDTEKTQKDKLYLNGGASFIPFFGFHTKQILDGNSLPVRYVALGRQYNPKPDNNFIGLYSVWQSTAAELFVAVRDEKESVIEFDKTVENLIDLYNSLDIHFRTVNIPACKLKPWESLRTSIQLYSPVNKAYIEIGNVSLIGDFISKRLRAYYSNNRNLHYLSIISGTAIRLPVLIANLLETSTKTQLSVPDVIKEEMIL